jgi:hypothetical protein
MGIGVYFGVSAVVHFLTRDRVGARKPAKWESTSLDLVALNVAGFVSFAVAGLSAARGVDHALPEIRHGDGVRPIVAGASFDPCTVEPCEGPRAFSVRIPESGSVYVAIHEFDDCDFGPWDPDGGPLLDAEGNPVALELQRFGDSERGMYLFGEPGSEARFAVGACVFSLIAKNVVDDTAGGEGGTE